MPRGLTAIARRFTRWLGRQIGANDEQMDVLAYGAFFVIQGLIITALVVIQAWIFGAFLETALVALTAVSLRRVGGGAHCWSPLRCTIVASLLYPLLGLLTQALQQPYISGSTSMQVAVVLLFILLALAGLFRYAPAVSPTKPVSDRIKAGLRRKARYFAMVLALALGGSLLLPASTHAAWVLPILVGWVAQVFHLTPAGFAWMNRIDRALQHLTRPFEGMEGGVQR